MLSLKSYLDIQLMKRQIPKESNLDHRCEDFKSRSSYVRFGVISCNDFDYFANVVIQDVSLKWWKF